MPTVWCRSTAPISIPAALQSITHTAGYICGMLVGGRPLQGDSRRRRRGRRRSGRHCASSGVGRPRWRPSRAATYSEQLWPADRSVRRPVTVLSHTDTHTGPDRPDAPHGPNKDQADQTEVDWTDSKLSANYCRYWYCKLCMCKVFRIKIFIICILLLFG